MNTNTSRKISAAAWETRFRMDVGGSAYDCRYWRDGTRGIDVRDDSGDVLYSLKFDTRGGFKEGRERKGDSVYQISRERFSLFASRYSDHIQWLARNLDPAVCNEMVELFTL